MKKKKKKKKKPFQKRNQKQNINKNKLKKELKIKNKNKNQKIKKLRNASSGTGFLFTWIPNAIGETAGRENAHRSHRRAGDDKRGYCDLVTRRAAQAAAISVLLSPGLLIIDHVHFQYNAVMCGILIASLVLARKKSGLLASGLGRFCRTSIYEVHISLPCTSLAQGALS